MIERLRKPGRGRGHPRPTRLSRYLDGELRSQERSAVEAHVRECARCRELLEDLAGTVRALGALGEAAPADVADSTIAALRANSAAEPDPRPFTVVRGSGEALLSQRSGLLSTLRYCLRRRLLRFTLPTALLAGVLLSLVNQGGMLFDGRVDLEMCATCATDFIVPFIVVNVGLLMVARVPRRRRVR